jgi:hypothetical protein
MSTPGIQRAQVERIVDLNPIATCEIESGAVSQPIEGEQVVLPEMAIEEIGVNQNPRR